MDPRPPFPLSFFSLPFPQLTFASVYYLRVCRCTHRPVGPLLAAVLPGPAPQLGVPGRLHVHRVDDVEELLDHGDALVHEVHLPVQGLLEKGGEEKRVSGRSYGWAMRRRMGSDIPKTRRGQSNGIRRGGREGRINQEEEEEEATRCAEMDEKEKTSLSSSSRGKE